MSGRGSDVAKNAGHNPVTEEMLEPAVDDIEDPSEWEGVTSSETDGPMGLQYCVTLTPEEAQVVARAELLADIDVLAIARHAILEAAHSLLRQAAAQPR